ncbi:hypothetical protein EON65_00325 [archaeon]|nr:MAG: hypothetical protein EON65_00325 [archaeon]
MLCTQAIGINVDARTTSKKKPAKKLDKKTGGSSKTSAGTGGGTGGRTGGSAVRWEEESREGDIPAPLWGEHDHDLDDLIGDD